MKLENYQPKGVQEPRDVPDGFPNKNFIALVLGSKGAGKTNMICNIVKGFQSKKFFDKIYLFTPTDDPKYAVLDKMADEVKRYEFYSDVDFKDVVSDIKTDLEEFKEYKRLSDLLKRFEKSTKPPELVFDDDELLDLYNMDFKLPDAKYDHYPHSLVILDDQAGNRDLFKSKSRFTSFAIRTRHMYTSIIYGIQLYKKGVPRGLRNNLDWWVLASNKSKAVQEDVAEDLSSYISKSEFIEKWDAATMEPFSWFCVNLMADAKYRFTKNIDEQV